MSAAETTGETRTRAPSESLSTLDATLMGIGAMVGAGVFVLTGLAARQTGPAVLLVFLLNGLVTLFTALSYAELVSAIPESGGGFAFVNKVSAPWISFLMGWMLWFAYMIAGSLYAIGFAENAMEFLHMLELDLHVPTVVSGVAILLLFLVINLFSTRGSAEAENLATIVKVGTLLIFILFGITVIEPDRFTPFLPHGPGSLLPAMGMTFIAFEGYDLITTVAGEVRNPRENIPRAIFYSLSVTVLIYLLVVLVGVGTVGADQLGAAGETAIAQAADQFIPDLSGTGIGGAVLIAFGAVFSTVSALNAVIIAASRIVFKMGREQLLPGGFGRIHHRFGTPVRALVATAAVILLGILLVPLETVGNLSSLFFLLSFIVVNWTVIRLRRERPDLQRRFRIPLYPVPPVLGIAANLLLGCFIDATTWLIGISWLAAGALVYFTLVKQQES